MVRLIGKVPGWPKRHPFLLLLIVGALGAVALRFFGLNLWLWAGAVLLTMITIALARLILQANSPLAKIGAGVLAVTVIGSTAVVLFSFKGVVVFLWLFSWLAEKLGTGDAQLNSYLASAIAAITALVGVWILGAFFKGYKKSALTVLACLISGYFFLLYQVAEEPLFTARGEGAKCYARGPGGQLEFCACNRKVHPVTGDPCRRITPESAYWWDAMNSGPIRRRRITPTPEMEPFSPVDGSPQYWYYEDAEGRLEIFDAPGHHPRVDVMLRPVDGPAAEKIFKHLRTSGTDRFIIDGPAAAATSEQPTTDSTKPHQTLIDDYQSLWGRLYGGKP